VAPFCFILQGITGHCNANTDANTYANINNVNVARFCFILQGITMFILHEILFYPAL
jgi:hypothetical protein